MDNEWRPWNGEYKKEPYEARLPDGTTFFPCWANAGHLVDLDTGRHIENLPGLEMRQRTVRDVMESYKTKLIEAESEGADGQ